MSEPLTADAEHSTVDDRRDALLPIGVGIVVLLAALVQPRVAGAEFPSFSLVVR